MEQITKFRAVDGSEFDKESDCVSYEALIVEVETIMRKLDPIPEMDGCNFSNGYGFVQQTRAAFLIVKLELLLIAKRYTEFHWIQQTVDDDTVHLSYAGRIIDECCPRPVNRAWYRLMCIDKQFREWGQPYYANNPEKAPYFEGAALAN